MAKLSRWPTYTLLAIFILPLLVFVLFNLLSPETPIKENIASIIENQAPTSTVPNKKVIFTAEDKWEDIYPNTKSMTISEVEVQASVAKTWPERILGLSNTPYIPEDVVKLFVFDTPGLHSIWMKDMYYAIDIIWATEEGEIVSLVENATPDSFPENFLPTTPAIYVIETKAGFVMKNNIKVGDKVSLPDLY